MGQSCCTSSDVRRKKRTPHSSTEHQVTTSRPPASSPQLSEDTKTSPVLNVPLGTSDTPPGDIVFSPIDSVTNFPITTEKETGSLLARESQNAIFNNDISLAEFSVCNSTPSHTDDLATLNTDPHSPHPSFSASSFLDFVLYADFHSLCKISPRDSSIVAPVGLFLDDTSTSHLETFSASECESILPLQEISKSSPLFQRRVGFRDPEHPPKASSSSSAPFYPKILSPPPPLDYPIQLYWYQKYDRIVMYIPEAFPDTSFRMDSLCRELNIFLHGEVDSIGGTCPPTSRLTLFEPIQYPIGHYEPSTETFVINAQKLNDTDDEKSFSNEEFTHWLHLTNQPMQVEKNKMPWIHHLIEQETWIGAKVEIAPYENIFTEESFCIDGATKVDGFSDIDIE